MFKNWSYKRKNITFLVAVVLLLIGSYFGSIAKTIQLSQENTALEEGYNHANDLQNKLAVLSMQKTKIDSLLKTLDLEGEDQLLLRQLTNAGNPKRTPLIEYMEVNKRSSRDVYNLFKFQGSYQELLKLLLIIERRRYGGSLASVNFSTVTNRRTKEKKLFMDLYFKAEQ